MEPEEYYLQDLNKQNNQFFIARTANEWIAEAERRPNPRKLFGEFWNEGELCFLFASTNVGKSILAVQIANAISSGEYADVFAVDCPPQKVLYFDFELSMKQFQNRYSDNYQQPYKFSSNFLRVEMNPDKVLTLPFETALMLALEQQVQHHNARVVIIDNITYLKSQSLEVAKETMPLMNSLLTLKRKYGLSMLVLAHTPKRDQSRPIEINDMAGSMMLGNLADSSFAIGKSTLGPNLRYIKQIKVRDSAKLYGTENVIVCELEKRDSFLQFRNIGYESEFLHLKDPNTKPLSELDRNIIELHRGNPEMSFREIARQLGTNHRRVSRVLEREEPQED
ncbi:MAG: AAA family ATPase [Chitinophagales bacterium]